MTEATDLADTTIERSSWIALTVIMGATIMVALDTTIVNVALHEIGEELHAESGIGWVVSAYLLAVCVAQPTTGWLADRLGRKPVFIASLAAFTGASVLCAMAPNLTVLVGARVLQGLGGGALMPVGMAIVLGLFPKARHGRAMAVWGMATMVAPALGPTLGGWLVTSVSWHWLFLINLPIGIVTIVAAVRLLPVTGFRSRNPFDGRGLIFGCGGLSLAVLGMSEGNSWGWSSPATLLCLGVGLAGLGWFVRHELRVAHPLIELRMFQESSFRLAMGAMLFVYLAQFGRLVFLPLQLEGLRGETALAVGVLFLPAAIASSVAMSIGGKLVDTIGPRRPIVIGCVFMIVAMVCFARLTLDTPLRAIAVFMCIQGFGVGLIMAPAMVAGLSELPPHLTTQGTAVRSLLGQVSGALAVAVLGAVVAIRSGENPSPAHEQAAYNAAFGVAAVGVVFALLLALRLPSRARERDGVDAVELVGAAAD
jgi:EmrB/QacA subfamily drug resistance transporter